jgi:ribonuclease BN (tRNA processing enzyme)
LRLTVVGCAGSFPSPDAPASCYLVEVPRPGESDLRLVLDLGNGALGPLQRLVGVHEVDAVLLTHLHPDHFLDLCGLSVALRYHPAGVPARRLPVYGPRGTFERLQQASGDESRHLSEVFDVREWSPGTAVGFGAATVTPVRVNHPVESYGLRVEARGAVLSYTGDTDSCPALRDLARDADLFLAEASFQEDRDAVRDVHLTGLRAGTAAADAGAHRLLLTHLPVWTDPAVVLAEARRSFGPGVEVVAAGSRYDL